MDMQMEVKEELALGEAITRLNAAASLLEEAADRFNGVELQASLDRFGAGEAARISARESDLEHRLAEAEATIATLKAGGRKTLSASATTLANKEGVTVEAGALDAALKSLSLEQRIAVKSEMLRSGLLG